MSAASASENVPRSRRLPRGPRVRVDVRLDAEAAPPDRRAWLRREIRTRLRAAAAAVLAPRANVAIDVLVTTEEGIRRLNHEFRDMDRTTDALSFPQWPAETVRALWRGTPPSCFTGKRGGKTPGADGGACLPVADLGGALAGGEPLGDIVLALPVIERQARRRRSPVEKELHFVLAHALLHLLGCDHNTPARRRVMWIWGWALVKGTPLWND